VEAKKTLDGLLTKQREQLESEFGVVRKELEDQLAMLREKLASQSHAIHAASNKSSGPPPSAASAPAAAAVTTADKKKKVARDKGLGGIKLEFNSDRSVAGAVERYELARPGSVPRDR